MSEKAPNLESLNTLAESSTNSNPVAETQTSSEAVDSIDIESVRSVIKQEASTNRLELPVDESSEGKDYTFNDRETKKLTLKTELGHIRTQLPLSEQLLSRTIHQPTIRRISDVSAKTITRPIGLLGGGILAFVGSLLYLLFSKYIGIKYNYFVFLLLFVFGYIVATICEFLIKALNP
ncbi:hypothetical protein M1512_01465 [Patescibacteria group bacterium]|jgi:hypothetical protein|nr:hypothetical protein [Patescibacteria group bacterium]